MRKSACAACAAWLLACGPTNDAETTVSASSSRSLPVPVPATPAPYREGATPEGWTLRAYSGPKIERLFDNATGARTVDGLALRLKGELPFEFSAMRPELARAVNYWSNLSSGCALMEDGSVFCHGDNSEFQFGTEVDWPAKWQQDAIVDVNCRLSTSDKATRLKTIRHIKGMVEIPQNIVFLLEDGSLLFGGRSRTSLAFTASASKGCDQRLRCFPYGPYGQGNKQTTCVDFSVWKEAVVAQVVACAPGTWLSESVAYGVNLSRRCLRTVEGSVRCWGHLSMELNPLEGIVDLTSSPLFALHPSGVVFHLAEYIRGNYQYQELGPTPWAYFPGAKKLGSVWTSVLGEKRAAVCALLDTGRIACAGGPWSERGAVLLPGLEDMVDIAGPCGLRRDGALYCWAPADNSPGVNFPYLPEPVASK